jgi:hypothetical protein
MELVSLPGCKKDVFLRELCVARLQEVRKSAVPLSGSKVGLQNQKRPKDENDRRCGDKKE